MSHGSLPYSKRLKESSRRVDFDFPQAMWTIFYIVVTLQNFFSFPRIFQGFFLLSLSLSLSLSVFFFFFSLLPHLFPFTFLFFAKICLQLCRSIHGLISLYSMCEAWWFSSKPCMFPSYAKSNITD